MLFAQWHNWMSSEGNNLPSRQVQQPKSLLLKLNMTYIFKRLMVLFLCFNVAALPAISASQTKTEQQNPSLSSSWNGSTPLLNQAIANRSSSQRLLSQSTNSGAGLEESLKQLEGQESFSAFEAMQAAEILGVKSELQRFRNLQAGASESYENETLALKSLLLRKTLLGFIQVRQASNKADVELSYTYDNYYREQRKLGYTLELFNLLNFSQLSVLYTVAPWSRINKQFIQSSILGEINAGLGIGIPILSILYARYHKIGNVKPPKFMESLIDGEPIDGSSVPIYVARFLDTPDKGETRSRREMMFAFWKKYYDVDPEKKETLAGINDNKSRSLGWLNKRIILLWSLRNQIQKFDRELLALANACRISAPSSGSEFKQANLSQEAAEAAQLLRIEKQISELRSLNESHIFNKRRLELEATVLEQVLAALLEVRIATDKVDQELNYSYDIALADLLAKRGSKLQKNFEANFIQTGICVAVAKFLFLKNYGKAANEVLVISGGVGSGLSALSIWLGQGGRRPISDKPNSLAAFMELDPANYHFSRMMTEFLDTLSEESNDGKSKKEFLKSLWKKENIGGMRHASNSKQHKLAALPPAKWDNIQIITKRIELLFSLKINLEFLDKDLLALMEEAGFDPRWQNAEPVPVNEALLVGLTPHAAEAGRLLEIQHPVTGLFKPGVVQDENTIRSQLSLTRKVMQALIDLRVTADRIEFELVKETETSDRMVRARDKGIAFTTNTNFFQLDILAMIGSGPLALSGQKRYRYWSDVMNLISGYLVTGFTAASFLQQKGGYRPTKASPNMLSQILGLETEPDLKYSPFIWRFLNTPNPNSPTGMTRREQLLEYWRTRRLLSRNPNDHSRRERLAANGSSHHWWNETIKLIDARLNMLRALHATVDMLERDLSELLLAAD